MRIRQVKPAFWTDARLADLSEATRLFYIGVWMLADDAGWLDWNQSEIALQLYGYEQRPRREKRVQAMWAELVAAGRVIEHDCGHGQVPTLADHQRFSGATKQVRTVYQRHLHDCVKQVPADTRRSPHLPARNGREQVSGTGTYRDVSESIGSARESADDQDRRALMRSFARQGLPVEAVS